MREREGGREGGREGEGGRERGRKGGREGEGEGEGEGGRERGSIYFKNVYRCKKPTLGSCSQTAMMVHKHTKWANCREHKRWPREVGGRGNTRYVGMGVYTVYSTCVVTVTIRSRGVKPSVVASPNGQLPYKVM